MEVILLVIHLILALALIGVILIQRSEGGALGIGGGGGGMGGFMTGRATANLLTRATAIIAAGFFLTSMALTWVGTKREGAIVQGAPAASGKPSTSKPAPKKPAGPQAPVK
ncbi:MAG TPA: preprotein translocase subunit SecG [Alphaproteobacteria bacterium]|nr:preprotein translocase subunit SecG [Alphaproteobacteria bacterium]